MDNSVEASSESETGTRGAAPRLATARRPTPISMANFGVRIVLQFRIDAAPAERWTARYFWDNLRRVAGKKLGTGEAPSAEALHDRALETLGVRLKAHVAREVARHFASSPDRLELLSRVRFDVVSIVYGSATLSVDVTGVAQLAEALDYSYPFFERILRQFLPLEILAIAEVDRSQTGLMEIVIEPGLLPRAFEEREQQAVGSQAPSAGAAQPPGSGLLNLRTQSVTMASWLWIASNLSLIPAVLLMWAVMRETRTDAREQRVAADSAMRAVVEHQWKLLNRRMGDSVPPDTLPGPAVASTAQDTARP